MTRTTGFTRPLIAGLLVVSAATACVPASAGISRVDPQPEPGGAVIRLTAHGIPHVLAADYRGLGLGAGYAAAEQNLCAIADIVLTTAGQRSRWFGPGDSDTNVSSDTYHAWLNQTRTVERLLAGPAAGTPSVQARELVRGYAAGVNRYLAQRTVAGLPDKTCRGAGWVRPVTELDIWRRAYQIAENQGGEAYLSWIVAAAPPTANDGSPHHLPPPRHAAPKPASNAIAIGRSASAAGTGLLLANPHLPWNGDLRLFQQQLTIPGELDVSGAGFLGLPVVNIGHTDRLAWSHTAATAQTATLTKLRLTPGDPTSYLVDRQRHRLRPMTVTVAVRGSDGRPHPTSHTVYRSPDGPVVAGPGLPWSDATAYVLHDANATNLRLIDQYLAVDRSHDVGQLRSALARHLGVPWAFTVAADATGTAYFSDVQVVPHVTDELIRLCGGALSDNPIILDGSRSSCRWGSDSDAVAPGLFGPGRLPTLTRTDTVSNMNDSAWLTNPAAPLTGYPAVLGDTGTPRSARTRLGLDMIARRIDGTDGLGSPGFTLATLQQTMLGDRNLVAEQGRAAVLTMCRSHPALPAGDGDVVDVRPACDVLAGWNGRGDLDSRGAYLWQKFVQLADQREVPLSAVPFDEADPLHTPRGVAADRPEVRRTFADLVQLFQRRGIPVDVPLRAVQHYAGVPIHGCDNGCFNIIMDDREPGPVGSLPDVAFGSSFIMAVELTDGGPRARTLLTYGQSADPSSPEHADQARLYSGRTWVTDRFSTADILADPALDVIALPAR